MGLASGAQPRAEITGNFQMTGSLPLLASEQRLLPPLLYPCARSLALPTRMASPARLLSAELRFASVLKNQLTREFRKLLNKRIQHVCLHFSPPSPPLLPPPPISPSPPSSFSPLPIPLFFFLFFETWSCSPGWPQIYYVAFSASQTLG